MSILHSFVNNAYGTIQSNPLNIGDTNLVVDSTIDAKLSSLPFPFWLTLWNIYLTPDTDINMEIVEVTARPSANNYTITRAQQNTTAHTKYQNDHCALLWTKGNASEVITGDTLGTGGILYYGADKLPHLILPAAKGDTISFNGSLVPVVNTVGPNTYILQADSSQASGVKYNEPGAIIHNSTAKVTPVANDEFGFWDSVGNVIKKLTYGNLLTMLNALYMAIVTPGTSGNVLTSNGSIWQSSTPAPASLTYKNGCTTYAINISGAQTIAHGLGKIPKKITITATQSGGASQSMVSIGTYNGTTNSVVYIYAASSGYSSGTNNTNILYLISNSGSGYMTAIATFDATNITLTFSSSGMSGGTAQVMWEAEA